MCSTFDPTTKDPSVGFFWSPVNRSANKKLSKKERADSARRAAQARRCFRNGPHQSTKDARCHSFSPPAIACAADHAPCRRSRERTSSRRRGCRAVWPLDLNSVTSHSVEAGMNRHERPLVFNRNLFLGPENSSDYTPQSPAPDRMARIAVPPTGASSRMTGKPYLTD